MGLGEGLRRRSMAVARLPHNSTVHTPAAPGLMWCVADGDDDACRARHTRITTINTTIKLRSPPCCLSYACSIEKVLLSLYIFNNCLRIKMWNITIFNIIQVSVGSECNPIAVKLRNQ